MQKLLRPQDRAGDIIFGSIVIFIVAADQLTKALIRANLIPINQFGGTVLFDVGFFRIVHAQNTGAAFGFFSGNSLTIAILAIIAVIVILLIAFLMRSRWPFLQSMWVKVALAMIVGGTIGNNIIDRLRQGYVTDFLDFRIWPAFNVADAAISVGVGIVIYRLIFYPNGVKSKK
jgi:signal peptidase II